MSTPEEDAVRKLRERVLKLETAAAERIKDDPWWKWQPHPKQRAFVEDVLSGTADEVWAFCANRTGKTDAGAWLGAGFARFGRENPKYQISHGGRIVVEDYHTSGMVVSLDFPNSRDVVQPKLFNNKFGRDPSHEPFIPEREIEDWSVTNQILKLKNGNIIAFKSCDAGALKLAGVARDWVMFDEPPPKGVYEESVIRIGGGRELLLFGACTLLPPEGNVGGISWMFEEKVKPWLKGETPTVHIHQMSVYDNPHLRQSEIERLERMYPPGSLQHRIRLDGELLPGLAGSRAYTSFDSRVHVRPQRKEFAMNRPIVWFMDFNVAPLASGLGQYVGKVFHVLYEMVLEEGSIDAMLEAFHNLVPNPQHEIWIYGDASGNQRSHQTNMSSYRLLLQGLQQFKVPVRLKVPEANPAITARINAVNNACRDIKDGESRLEVDNDCKELIADLEGVLRDSTGGIKKTSNPKDPYSKRTHVSDALGYWIAREAPVATRVTQETSGERKIIVPRPGYKLRPTR